MSSLSYVIDGYGNQHTISGVASSSELPFVAVAHRGLFGGTIKENTLEALVNAYENGYTAVELDVRLTSDSVYVLNHDAYITVDSVQYNIADYTYEELLALFPSLTLLDDALEYCYRKNLTVVLDCKAVNTDIAEHVCAFGCNGRTHYNGGDATSIKAIDGKAKFHVPVNTSNDYSSWLTSFSKEEIILTVSASTLETYAENIAYANNNGFSLYVWNTTAGYETVALETYADFHEPNSGYEATFIKNAKAWAES